MNVSTLHCWRFYVHIFIHSFIIPHATSLCFWPVRQSVNPFFFSQRNSSWTIAQNFENFRRNERQYVHLIPFPLIFWKFKVGHFWTQKSFGHLLNIIVNSTSVQLHLNSCTEFREECKYHFKTQCVYMHIFFYWFHNNYFFFQFWSF